MELLVGRAQLLAFFLEPDVLHLHGFDRAHVLLLGLF